MQYMMLIYDEERNWTGMTAAEREQIMGEYRQYGEATRRSGHFQAGGQLQPVATSKSVRIRDGQRLITDGPFAETREQLGGFILIEAKDMDEALELAARIPSARMGTVEVRPMVPVRVPTSV